MVINVEMVKEITSISHDGFQSMWYPFHFEKELQINIINCEYFREGIDLIKLVHWMFATNNHNTNTRIDNSKSLGISQLVQCSVEFVTDKHRYLLSRIFHDKFSIEAKLEVLDSTNVYFGEDAIRTIQKMTRPIVVPSDRRIMSSLILKPQDNYSRQSMLNLVDLWSRSLGFENIKIGLTPIGHWSYYHSRKEIENKPRPSLLMLLSNLAQATVRKRKFGRCPAVICFAEMHDLNQLEIDSVIELISTICKEERLSFVLATSSIEEIDVESVSNTPRFAIYR